MSAYPSGDVRQPDGFARSSGLPALTRSGTAVAHGDEDCMRSPIHGLFEWMARWRLRRIAARRMRESLPHLLDDMALGLPSVNSRKTISRGIDFTMTPWYDHALR